MQITEVSECLVYQRVGDHKLYYEMVRLFRDGQIMPI